MQLCLPKAINDKFKRAIESGELNIDVLTRANSVQREALLEKHVSKGYAKTVSDSFSRKFGTDLTPEMAKDIMDSIGKVNALRAADKTPWNGKSKDWSREYVKLQRRMQSKIQPESDTLTGTIKGALKGEVTKIKNQEGIVNKGVQTLKSTADVLTSPATKSLKAAMDMSYAFRQGAKVLLANPKEYRKAMTESFKYFKAIGSKAEQDAIMDEFKATYLAHPNYDKLVTDGKLAFGVVEDWFPSAVGEKVPALGNIFKASNEAFTAFSQSARFGIANDLLERQMALTGKELTKDELKSIAYVANSLTGRGNLGRFENQSENLNRLFFSARYVKSQIDTFTMPFNQDLSDFARKEALKESAKILGTVGTLISAASLFGDVELDPRSSAFGKAQIGDYKIDLTAGLGSYITLASRVLSWSKKNNNGKVIPLNSGKYGSDDVADILTSFAGNKLAPSPGMIYNIAGKGSRFGGKEITPVGVATDLVAPISINNMVDFEKIAQEGDIGGYLADEDKASALVAAIAEILGFGVSQPVKK